MTTLGAGGAETMVDEDVFERTLSGVFVHGHGHALASGQTISLDDDRCAMLVHVSLSHVQVARTSDIWRSECCDGP